MLLAHCLPAKQGHATNHLRSTTSIEYCLAEFLQNAGTVKAAIKPRKNVFIEILLERNEG